MEVPYYQLKGRGDLYSVIGEKGEWKGVFQVYFHIESCNWITIFF